LTESVGIALLVVLDTLRPAERLAFVLHDGFAVPFADIAPIIGRSTHATKMLASRARHRVRSAQEPDADPSRQRAVVDAFLAASRNGDFAALLEMLDPNVTARADAYAAPSGHRSACAALGPSRGRRWLSRTGQSTPILGSPTAPRPSWSHLAGAWSRS
jgi:RNA polymerase sigma-70 factor (ECF subfamily)